MKWYTIIIVVVIIFLLLFSSPDGDGLPTYKELNKGTNPFLADADMDGLNDGFESSNPTLDPLSKDILVEIDYDRGEKPRNNFENIQRVFRNAPVENVDGSTGIDIHIKIDDQISIADRYSPSDYRRSQPSYDNKKAIHAVVVEEVYGIGENAYGFAMPDTNGVVIQSESYDHLSYVLLHEIGHQIGLMPQDFTGIDSNAYSTSEYSSVMNYNCIDTCGLQFSNSPPFNDWEHIEKTLSER